MTDTAPPHRIRTQRCVLRVADPAEAVLLRAAIDSSLEHLRAWLHWAVQEPRSLAETEEHLVRGRERFEQSDDFQYSIFDGDEREILGGVGLHHRGEPGCLEIGYWIRRDRVGQGLAEPSGELRDTLVYQISDPRRLT